MFWEIILLVSYVKEMENTFLQKVSDTFKATLRRHISEWKKVICPKSISRQHIKDINNPNFDGKQSRE